MSRVTSRSYIGTRTLLTSGAATFSPSFVGAATFSPSFVGSATFSPSFVGSATFSPSFVGSAKNHARRGSMRHQLAVLVEDLALCGGGAPAHVNDTAVGCQLVTVERHSADVVELEFEGSCSRRPREASWCTAQPMTESSSVAQMPP